MNDLIHSIAQTKVLIIYYHVEFQVDFEMIGGLDKNIKMLKEIIILPLLCPDIFAKLHVNPVRGVLFHGPPGMNTDLLYFSIPLSINAYAFAAFSHSTLHSVNCVTVG